MKIYSPSGDELLDLLVDDKSYRYKAVMDDNTMTLYFNMPAFHEIPQGSYCEFKAERYFLLEDENFKQNHSRDFEYTLTLNSYQSLTKEAKFKFFTMNAGVVDSPFELKFSLTATPREFAQRIVDNMNIYDHAGGWTVGNCIESDPVCIDFNHDYCFDVLAKIVDAFKTEWEFDNKTLNIGKVEKSKDSPVPLKYGYNCGLLPGTSRANMSSSKVISRLFIEGSDRNIDSSTYGTTTLHMPKSTTITYEGVQYRTDATGTYLERVTPVGRQLEGSVDLTKIYPKRIGTVSAVNVVNATTNLYDIVDSSIPDTLNFAALVIGGETMTIVFQTGQLAGKEFDVTYKSADKRFEIVPTSDNGVNYPSGSLIPKNGDKYAVFHIDLPTEYKTQAETDVLNEAVKYLWENEQPKYTYTGTLDEIYAKKNWLEIGGKLNCGYFVSLRDEQYLTTPVSIRIVGVKEYINKPKEPEITLSNEVTGKLLSSELNKTSTQEQAIDRKDSEVVRFARRQFADVKQTTAMLQNSLLNFSSSISPITVNTMQLIAGDETLQFDFVLNQNSTTAMHHSEMYDAVHKQFSSESGVLQHKTLGITTVSSSHAASEYKWWNMTYYISPVLNDASKSYYLYARVNKADHSGTFLLSEIAIALEGEEGYYHLLMGILNSEIDGDRSYSSMYGFTEVLPGRVITDKVVSSNGETYFDLLNNKIKGYIEFMDGLIAGMIKLSSNGVVTAGLQGDSAVNVGAWFGGTYEDALSGIAKIIEYKDGSFQFGGGSFRGDAAGNIITDMGFEATEGHVGGFSIFENSIMNDTVEFADEEVETLNQLLNPVINKIIKDSSWHAASLPNAMAYTQELTLANSGSISFSVTASAGTTAEHGAMTLKVWVSDESNSTIFSDNITATDNGIIPKKTYNVRLPTGRYIIHALGTQNSNVPTTVDIIGEQIRNDDNTFSEYIRAVPSSNRNKLGNNGMFSFWDSSNYHYYSVPFGFKNKGACSLVNTSYNGFVTADNPDPIIRNINRFNSFILSGDDTIKTLNLPNINEFEIGINDVVLRVIVAYTNGGTLRIESKTGATLYDWDGNAKTRINMSIGDSIELHAIKVGLEMKYFITRMTGCDLD